ncbi:hypothetical protein [Aquimarina sp. SS2-1]|uniref:hypothetical protein n=1 Tax=Aquimarina besae TaxID=3342247 RepID=UPI00367198FD
MKNIQKVILALCFLFLSCENEPFESLVEKIDVNSELYDNLKAISEATTENSETVCLTFIYPFNIYIYDNNDKITERRFVNHNDEFIALLEQMEQGSSIGMSYPISGMTDDGNTIRINNNSELKEAIEACIEEQIIALCNDTLEEDCVWKITSLSQNTAYDTSLLSFYDDGTGVFYHSGDSFRTTWITLYIDSQLYVNINLEEDTTVSEDWNFNWEATFVDENTILINSMEQIFEIKKICNIENNCDYLEFRECEVDSTQTANFIFEDYITCITSFRHTDTNEDYILSFYETESDAEDRINALSPSGYENITNPQIIFVNIASSEEVMDTIRIVLYASICEEEN